MQINRKFPIKFSKLGLAEWLVDSCAKRKIVFATEIQQVCIPAALKKKDLLIFSGTGTGKTLAFLLPALHLVEKSKQTLSVVVVVPTEELGFQIFEIFNNLGKKKHISCCLIDKNLSIEKIKLPRRPSFVVTPKLFSLLHKKKSGNPGNIDTLLILDELDLVVKNPFFNKFSLLVKLFNPIQTLVFGVTFTKGTYSLTRARFKNNFFFFHEKRNRFSVLSRFNQEYIFCPFNAKLNYLKAILSKKSYTPGYPFQNSDVKIIFFPSRKICESISDILVSSGFQTIKLHQGMHRLERFLSIWIVKKKKSQILLSTDSGIRGLDFPSVKSIINFNFPSKISTYIYRLGRTCRLDKTGHCISLINQKEISLLDYFEKQTGVFLKKSEMIKENDILPFISKNKNFRGAKYRPLGDSFSPD